VVTITPEHLGHRLQCVRLEALRALQEHGRSDNFERIRKKDLDAE
jgi:hypothetical protein